jgi:hypothetical protein
VAAVAEEKEETGICRISFFLERFLWIVCREGKEEGRGGEGRGGDQQTGGGGIGDLILQQALALEMAAIEILSVSIVEHLHGIDPWPLPGVVVLGLLVWSW